MSPSGGPPGQADLTRYNAATASLEPPFAVVDLAALRANAADMTRRAGGKPIRLASKSVRCRALLEQVLGTGGFHGILAFSLPEALWLAGQGVSDDIVVAYPSTDRTALTRLASDPAAAAAITVMIDSPDQLDIIEKAAAAGADPAPVQVCLDIDTSYVGLGGMIRAGARRSPVRTPAQAAALARDIAGRPGIRLAGLMAYEAQIAGVGDKPPGRPAYALVIRQMQRRSAAELARRRAAIVAAVRRRHRLDRGDRGRGRGHRDRRRLGSLPAQPVRQLPGLLRAASGPVRAVRGAAARRRGGHRGRRRVRGVGTCPRQPPPPALPPARTAAGQAGRRR
jgi:D-serine deaminase-like pyridoxal phosphate-dependent protein